MDTGKNRNYIYVTDLNFAAEYRLRRISIDANIFNPHLLKTAYFANINKYLGIDKLSNRGTGR
jgi:hypothetical protein